MADEPLSSVLRLIRRLAAGTAAGALTDRQLLQNFALDHDEVAFAALVRRHGPLVLGVCERILRHAQDAEDVFQATFLVLARKAAVVPWRESVSNWLYAVAYRLATEAKAKRARRQTREKEAAEMPPREYVPETEWHDLHAVLDEELHRLPAKYRGAILLCYLEGKWREEAARQLGCPLGTLKHRLERGRALLQTRLTRRGLTLSTALLITGLSPQAATAAVPTLLALNTAKAATAFVTGSSAVAGAVSAQAAVMAEGTLKAMMVTNVKLALAWTLAVSLAAAGAGGVARQALVARWREAERVELQLASILNADPVELPPESTLPVDQPKPAGEKSAPTDRYGDPLPKGAIARFGTVRMRTGGQINGLAFSPDGKSVLVSRNNEYGTLRAWDVRTGQELDKIQSTGSLRYHGSVLSPDGKAWASMEGEVVVLLDVATGKERLRLAGHQRTRWGGGGALAFSPDGQTLASAWHDDAIILWDRATAKPLRRISTAPHTLSYLAFSPDGGTLAGTENGVIRLWNGSTGRPLLEAPEAHRGHINQVLFLPDGRTLVTASDDRTIRFWDVATSRQRLVLRGHGYWVRAIALSPDGKTLASSSFDDTVRLWEVATGRELLKLPGHGNMGGDRGLTFTPDGKALASWGNQLGTGIPRCWEIPSGKEIPRPPGLPVPRETVNGRVLATSPDANLVFGHHESGSYLLDLRTGNELPLREGSAWAQSATFSPDSKILAAEVGAWPRGGVRLWEVATGEVIRTLDGAASASALAFSPDGRQLAAGLADSSALLWDLWRPPARPGSPLTPQALQDFWHDLSRSVDAGKAYAAIWALADVPEQSIPFLRSRLTPSTAAVPARIRKLIADLDSDQFAVREAASRELQRLGDEITADLRRALAGKTSAELRRRVMEFMNSPRFLRPLRAVGILERIGSSEAREVLKSLATSAPEDQLSQEAKASLERLAKRQATTQ